MVCASYKTIFVMLAAMAVSSTQADLSVCYAPWGAATVSPASIETDLRIISEHYTTFRSFEIQMHGLNIITLASTFGLKVAAGVFLNDASKIESEIQAVCDGYEKHPEAVKVIYVGNENLKNGGFGDMSVDTLIGYIRRVKECTKGGVDVGTVQRINEWLHAEGADRLLAECKKAGVNIYPFFTSSNTPAIQKLKDQWQQIASKYGVEKFEITETGWPTAGEPSPQGEIPSLETSQKFYDDLHEWAKMGSVSVWWFKMFDSLTTHNGAEYEKHFGLYNVDRTPKLTIPGNNGSTPIDTTSPTSAPGISPPPQTEVDVPEPLRTPMPAVNTPGASMTPPTDGNVPETPGSVTPGLDAPASGAPNLDAPVGQTPAPETPMTPQTGVNVPETPVSDTPAGQTPISETPAGQTSLDSVTPAPGLENGSSNEHAYGIPETEVGIPLTRTPETEAGVPLTRAPEFPDEAYTPVHSGKECPM